MLRYSVQFFAISVVAGMLGHTETTVTSAGITQFLFYIFMVLCIAFLSIHLMVRKN